MDAKLSFDYSTTADVLCIEKCPTYIGQETEDIDDLIIARFNPDTDEIEYLEIIFPSKRIVSRDPFQLNIPVEPGYICGSRVAPEFHCLIDPESRWLTIPRAAVVGMEFDARPPKYPTYPGNRPADIRRFELHIHRGLMTTMLDVSYL